MRVKTRRRKRNRMVAGGAGTLHRVLNMNNSKLLGAGGYGITITLPNPKEAIKLLYSTEECAALRYEASLQNKISRILSDIIHVPKVNEVFTYPTTWFSKQYLCGIVMERIPLHPDFGEVVHMLFGYNGDDVNKSWGAHTEIPVSSENPTRGYFASSDMLEAIWEDDGVSYTIESVSRTIGLAYRTLVLNGIIPIDIEWIYGGDGRIHAIDFGLCIEKYIPLERLLTQKGTVGFYGDIYVPKEGDRGYPEFIQAYLHGK
jgi:hypothetical protein